jgi:hypothetical protein
VDEPFVRTFFFGIGARLNLVEHPIEREELGPSRKSRKVDAFYGSRKSYV